MANSPRDNELTDLSRWSSPSLNINTATVGPFVGGEEHRFYIDVEDDVGFRSLGIVRFTVVQSALDRFLI